MIIETLFDTDSKPGLGQFLDYPTSTPDSCGEESNVITFKNFRIELIQNDWIEKCLQAIQKYIGDTQIKQFNLQINFDRTLNQYNLNLPIDNLPGLCGISMDIIFDGQSILCVSYYTKYDQTPYYASNKNIINTLTYCALRYNESINYGALSINPQTGLFTYKTFTQFSKLEQQTCHLKVLEEFFQFQYTLHLKIMKKSAPKILYLMNKITRKQYKYCKKMLVKDQINQIQQTQSQHNQQKQQQQQIEQQEDLDKDDQLLKEIKEIVEQKCIFIMTDEQEKQYFASIPVPKNLPILTEINIAKPTNNQVQINSKGQQMSESEILLNEWKTQPTLVNGGYAEIRKTQITYKVGDILQKRYLALKTDQLDKIAAENEKKKKQNQSIEQECNDHKVIHELKMLKHLAKPDNFKRGEGFIATSYYDPKIDGCYFMEFYNNGSLDQYVQSKSIVLSLRTKLFILAGIIQGIEFMHKKGIAHMDLKLGNVLVQKQLMPKICDFGEAQFIHQIKKDKSDYSYTIPYSAPELFNNEEITEAYDIFSFGVVMCQLIFEQYPFEFNPSEPSSLEQRFKNNTYAIKRNLPNQIKQGPKKIMKYIVKLIFLCLQSKPDVRPKPSWLTVAIWKMINYIDCF